MTVDLTPYLDGLNPRQQEAVCHKDGPLLVLAGPGSGKTRVVTHRIAALIAQGVRGYHIAALTFTNKAAEEMQCRIESLVPSQGVWIGTFHRFCARLLRQYAENLGFTPNYTIYDVDEAKKILDAVLVSHKLPAGVNAASIQNAISWAKNGLVLPEEFVPGKGSLLGEAVAEIYPLYQKELLRANAVDFDDLLVHMAVLLRREPEIREKIAARFHYLLVDEYQDTNLAQYAIARSLATKHQNLSVTGDPDQSIYGWRGANLRNILDFEKDFENVKIVKLEQNYRSTPQILKVAAQLIDFNKQRKKKTLFTHNAEGPPVRLFSADDQQDEAEAIASEIASEIASGRRRADDFAIFYRMNALSRNLEHALRRENVPFQLVRGLEFFNRKEIKDLIAYLNLIHNPNDSVSLARIINEPARGIGKTTLKKITDAAMDQGVATLEMARRIARGEPIRAMPPVSPKIRKAIAAFTVMLDRWSKAAEEEYPIEALLGMVIDDSRYREQFSGEESEEDQERLENIDELISEAREFDRAPLEEGEIPLEKFLEQAALVSDVDAYEGNSERVSLMTFHAAKGLEFPVVYIIALEENILPHERSQGTDAQMEEERRLFFVGITRAREELRLSRTRAREFRGRFGHAIMSRFLMELPTESMELCDDAAALRRSDEPYVVYERRSGKSGQAGDDATGHSDDSYDGIDSEYDDEGRTVLPKRRRRETARKLNLMTGEELFKKHRQNGKDS